MERERSTRKTKRVMQGTRCYEGRVDVRESDGVGEERGKEGKRERRRKEGRKEGRKGHMSTNVYPSSLQLGE
jgi:hypothetical protein